MTLIHGGKTYSYLVGSDVVRDGMYIDIHDEAGTFKDIMEVFYSDMTHTMTVTLYKPDVPLEVVEWAIAVARERLPVKTDTVD